MVKNTLGFIALLMAWQQVDNVNKQTSWDVKKTPHQKMPFLKSLINKVQTYLHKRFLLKHSGYLADDVIANMPGYIFWKNKKLEYMGCNNNLAEVSGLTNRIDIIGKKDTDFYWGKEQGANFIEDDLTVMRERITKVSEHKMPVKRPDGEYYIVRTEKMPLYQRNKVAGVVAVAVDITDQKKLEEKLIKEKHKSEAANLMKTAFMRNMEHDIRTPFSGIWAIANHLYETETDEKRKEDLRDVTQAAKELLDYCNSILDFSKIESGLLAVIDKKFNLFELVTSVMAMELPAAKHKQLTLESDIDHTIPPVLIGDAYRLQRILINLISNAIKFTSTGGVTVTVSLLKRQRKSALIRFIIDDTGVGIPEEKQDYIFERFSRLSLSNTGLYKGMGLGLQVVKQFMNELCGEIDVLSEVDKGTTFVCTLPFKIPLTHDFVECGLNRHSKGTR